MVTNKMEELFEKLQNLTGISDIGFHQIKNEKLNPIYKSKTGDVDLEKWKEVHSKNPVYIKDTPVLQDVIKHKKPIFILDTQKDTRSSNEFFLFGIDSILIIPIIKDKEVIGILCIVSVGEIRNVADAVILKCVDIVKDYEHCIIEQITM